MQKVQRIGVSLEEGLLERFDELIAAQGYENRSEAIRDLIRKRLTEDELANPKAEAVAAVFVVYDHHCAQLAQKLIQLQHSEFFKSISAMHVHLDHHNCLEVILLKGKVGEITKLGERLVSLKGVKLGKVNLITGEQKD